jgi:hypothetical protein
VAFVPPRRVRVEGVGVGVREGENKRRGSEICSRSVVDPAVPGSAEKLPGRVICPGLNSTAQEPFATPVTLPEDISAASAIPNERQLSIRVWQRESVPRIIHIGSRLTCSMLVLQPRGFPPIPYLMYGHRFGEKCRQGDGVAENLATAFEDAAVD